MFDILILHQMHKSNIGFRTLSDAFYIFPDFTTTATHKRKQKGFEEVST